MKRIFGLFVLSSLFIISACSPQPAPAATPTPKPTTTPTPQPFTGRLFFDMNGSGLQDESSFVYDKERLEDPRQPLQPDLDKSIKAYVAAHPSLKNGDLVTIPEPGLSGYKVCIEQDCATTSANGSFSINKKSAGATALLKITDPYVDKPALAMRYINEWVGAVTIPAYEMNEVKIPEQYLNDTHLVPIAYSKSINVGERNNIALLQGFLTLPFLKEQVPNPLIFSYFDIVGIRLFDSKNNFYNTQDGVMLNFNGEYSKIFSPDPYIKGVRPNPGVGDSHNGLDFFINVGNYILSASTTSSISSLPDEGQETLLQTSFKNPSNNTTQLIDTYGHLRTRLVIMNQKIYRGQFIAISGDSYNKAKKGGYPQLHFDLFEHSNRGSFHYDPFRTIITLDPKPLNYWGSEVSWWTVDNLPRFPLAG